MKKHHRKLTCASGSVRTRGVYKNGNCQDSCQTSTFVQLRPLWYQTLIEPLSFVHLFRSSNCVVSLHANAQCGWRLFQIYRLNLDSHLLEKKSNLHSSDRPSVWFWPNFNCVVPPKWQNSFLQNTEFFFSYYIQCQWHPFIFQFCLMTHMCVALS
mgnify:CR=1 FL=1